MTDNDLRNEIERIEAEHAEMAATLERFQELLVGLELGPALGAFEAFVRRTRGHIRLEEERLLPVYAALPDLPKPGKPDVFLKEHAKIERLLEEVLTTARSLSDGPGLRRSVVRLLARAGRLRDVLEHHAAREEAFLIPRLRRRLLPSGGEE